jgi:uncharacterized protein YjbI with pentapeptide repeats
MAREDHEYLIRKTFTDGLDWDGKSFQLPPASRRPWENWKRANPTTPADLSGMSIGMVDLSKLDLSFANLEGATLSSTHLQGANLSEACLRGAKLSDADLSGAVLINADLRNADMTRTSLDAANFTSAHLSLANLTDAHGANVNFERADLRGANLQKSVFINTAFRFADLTGCAVYGSSIWDAHLDEAIQNELLITPRESSKPMIRVDNLEVAQFMYLLLNNQKIRQVIDTITSKVVLILGRFTPERKVVLDAIRERLRSRDYLPVLFDFDKPTSRDITETVSTLAHMARFVVADITDAKSIPQELMAIVPTLPSVPVQPLLAASQQEYGMFEHFRRYPWVLEPYLYEDQDHLLASLDSHVIRPAESKARERIST